MAHDLLLAGAEQADGVSDLFRVSEGACGIGAQIQDHALDLGIVGEPPEPAQEPRVAAHTGRVADTDARDLDGETQARLPEGAVGRARRRTRTLGA